MLPKRRTRRRQLPKPHIINAQTPVPPPPPPDPEVLDVFDNGGNVSTWTFTTDASFIDISRLLINAIAPADASYDNGSRTWSADYDDAHSGQDWNFGSQTGTVI